MKRSHLVCAGIALAICASAWGQRSLSRYAPLNVSGSQALGEGATEFEVRESLQRLPYYGVFDYLAYTVDGSTVILFGKVMKRELKNDAAMVASTAQGVTGVINHITLLRDSPSENRIRLAVFGAIYGDASLGRYAYAGNGGAIHIVVEGEKVTLEGEVALAADARRAVQRVSKVPRVLRISNHLAASK